MKTGEQELTLHESATYQIKVPGRLDETWLDWAGGMTVAVEGQGSGSRVTTFTGTIDQAALHGLLRQLYALGLPLISVRCIERSSEDAPESDQPQVQGESISE